jgi:hypothetical protein
MFAIKKSHNSLIPVRVGALLISAGIVRADQLAIALAEARRNDRRLGEVLVYQKLATAEDLDHALQLQQLIKAGKITVEMGVQALKQAREKGRNIHAALSDMGWHDENAIKTVDLSSLLVEAGIASRDQINQASWNSAKNMLPLGRNLVLAGAISPSILGSALTALVLLRDEAITREQAVEGLINAHRHKVSLEECLSMNAGQNHVRIGELLSAAGLLTESDAMIAVENGLLNQKSIGSMLLQCRMVTPVVLDACLKLQKLIEAGSVARTPAIELLRQVAAKQLPLDQFLNEIAYLKSRVLQLLLAAELVTQYDVQCALALNAEYEQDMVRGLSEYGVLSADLFRAAVRCVYAIDSGNYSLHEMCVSLKAQFTRASQSA